MFTHKHYVPILKAKTGELKALEGLSSRVAESITPLLEIVPPTKDSISGKPRKSLEEHCEKVANKILKHWGDYSRFFVDTDLLSLKSPKRKRDKHPLESLFELMRIRGLKAVPVTGVFHNEMYQRATARIVQTDRRGVCLRLRRDHFVAPDRETLIEDTLKTLGCSRTEVDLIVDFGPVTLEERGKVLLDFVDGTASLQELSAWRSFTFAASSFPAVLPPGKGPMQCKLVRVEWSLWRLLMDASPSSLRKPAFGDYGIVHPVFLEYKPRKMNASRANLRYTADDYWVILRSGSVLRRSERPGDAPSIDLHLHQQLCQKLISMPDVFSGRDFSQGDERIELCASHPDWTKGSTESLFVGTSHHITKVIGQISTLS